MMNPGIKVDKIVLMMFESYEGVFELEQIPLKFISKNCLLNQNI